MPQDPFYNSRPWRDARATQLAKCPFCETCRMVGLRVRATEVDHRRAVSKGGAPFDPANLCSLCKTHHSQKTILLDGQHRDSGKQIVVTGPDGWSIHTEGAPIYGNAQNQFNPPQRGGRRKR